MIRIKQYEDGYVIKEGILPGVEKKVLMRPLVVHAMLLEEDIVIETVGGERMLGKAGDWLIKGIQNEYSVVAASLFALSFDICSDDGNCFGEHDGK